MIWTKIFQFVAWIVVSTVLFFLFTPITKYITNRFTEEQKFAHLLVGLILPVIYSLLSMVFTIWILTWSFLLGLYFQIFLMHLSGIALLIILTWRISGLNNQALSRLILKEVLASKSSPDFGIFANLLPTLISMTIIVAIFYIVIILNISLHVKARYIILISFVSGSVFSMLKLGARIPVSCASGLDNEVRMSYLLASSSDLYLLSFSIYFIFWALNIDISSNILVIRSYNFSLLFVVALIILATFMLLLVLPFSVGENRDRKNGISLLEKRLELIKELEKLVDLTDLEKSKTDLKAINEKILNEYNSINEELLNKQQKFENLKHGLEENKVLYSSWKELDRCFSDFFQSELSYVDWLRRYREHITFTLESRSRSSYADLDKLTDDWKDDVFEELGKIKKERPLFRKIVSVIILVWVSLNTVLGATLTVVLRALGIAQ